MVAVGNAATLKGRVIVMVKVREDQPLTESGKVDIQQWLTRLQEDVRLRDPERLLEGALTIVGRHRIPKVAYVSCDPATLARDAAHLVHAGYRVKQVAVADMFLHTAHMETLMLFEYAG